MLLYGNTLQYKQFFVFNPAIDILPSAVKNINDSSFNFYTYYSLMPV